MATFIDSPIANGSTNSFPALPPAELPTMTIPRATLTLSNGPLTQRGLAFNPRRSANA